MVYACVPVCKGVLHEHTRGSLKTVSKYNNIFKVEIYILQSFFKCIQN